MLTITYNIIAFHFFNGCTFVIKQTYMHLLYIQLYVTVYLTLSD